MTKKELLQRVEALATIMDQDHETNINNLALDNIHIKKEYYYPGMYAYIQYSLEQILREEGIEL